MKNYICEYCGKKHDGSYGSGRFCSKNCKCAFNGAKAKHGTINSKCAHTKLRAPYGTWKCICCDMIFETRQKLKDHNHEFHPISKGKAWNSGCTKENDKRLAKAANTLHVRYSNGELIPFFSGKHHTIETKKQVSKSMKLAHKEGRAYNIGTCRWNNEPSYPEKWFMEVIANEFNDKNYVREHPFHKYSLDFAWIDKKKCIEIDGKQHHEDLKQQERDKNKDKLLFAEGWKLLRLDWKWVFKYTQDAIKLAKEFIES